MFYDAKYGIFSCSYDEKLWNGSPANSPKVKTCSRCKLHTKTLSLYNGFVYCTVIVLWLSIGNIDRGVRVILIIPNYVGAPRQPWCQDHNRWLRGHLYTAPDPQRVSSQVSGMDPANTCGRKTTVAPPLLGDLLYILAAIRYSLCGFHAMCA